MDFQALISTFANNLLPILLVSGAGFLLGKALHVDSRGLGRVVFYVFSPILVFNLILHTDLSGLQMLGTISYAILACASTGNLANSEGRRTASETKPAAGSVGGIDQSLNDRSHRSRSPSLRVQRAA